MKVSNSTHQESSEKHSEQHSGRRFLDVSQAEILLKKIEHLVFSWRGFLNVSALGSLPAIYPVGGDVRAHLHAEETPEA